VRVIIWPKVIFATALLLVALSAGDFVPRLRRTSLPSQVVWAWERKEDLRSLPAECGVAFLADTVVLRGSSLSERPRLFPLLVSPGKRLTAVVRLEGDRPISHALIPQLSQRLVSFAALPNVEGLQIDFDAHRSQRDSYAELLRRIRDQLPKNQSLSITALASWCEGDDWLHGLPIDYAVPMLFRLGPEREEFRHAAESGQLFREPVCRGAVGLSTDEPLDLGIKPSSIFWFSPTPWSAEQFRALGKTR
jgi:hypothetical protein